MPNHQATALFADYEDERRAFERLFDASCSCRIVLFQGASGKGKTALLRHCLGRTPAHIAHLQYDFKGDVSVAEVFHRAGQSLTWPRLPRLTQQVAYMQQAPAVHIDSNWLAGINNRISVALHAESPIDREHRRSLLTNAWFEDLQALQQPVLLVFDTFEKAPTEMQQWISGPVLARAALFANIRVVIAGQEVPDRHSIEWGDYCDAHTLYGVREAAHWLPVLQAMHRRIPGSMDPFSWLAGVCDALGGNPSEILKVIDRLPREESGP